MRLGDLPGRFAPDGRSESLLAGPKPTEVVEEESSPHSVLFLLVHILPRIALAASEFLHQLN